MKKNQLIVGLAFFLLGLLVAIGPHTLFAVCEAMGDGFMKCHWTAQAETGIGLSIALAGLLSVFFAKEEYRIGIHLGILLQTIVVILIPNVLIGVCGGEHMRCHALTLPALDILGVIVFVLGVGNSLYLWKQLKERR